MAQWHSSQAPPDLLAPPLLTPCSAPLIILFSTASQFGRASFKDEPSYSKNVSPVLLPLIKSCETKM